MKKYRLSISAKTDFAAIGRYTKAKWGMKQHNLYLQKLLSAFEAIAEYPQLGHKHDDTIPGLRSRIVEKHIIYYIAQKDIILIYAILHQSMEPDLHLSASSHVH